MARTRPRKNKKFSTARTIAVITLAGIWIAVMAGLAWYLFGHKRPAPPLVGRVANRLARAARQRLARPPLAERGRIVSAGTRRGAAGEIKYIVWAGYSETGLILAEKAIEDAWRQVHGVRVGITRPRHETGGEKARMVAGLTEIPLVELVLKLEKKPPPSKPAPPRLTPPKPPVTKTHPGKIAIIIDDVGNDLPALRQLLALPVPLTFSVLPYAEHSEEACAMLEAAGVSVMLHMPMEPESFSAADPGPGALLVSMTPAQIRNKTLEALAAVPPARGVNNHMGSLFTADPAAMRAFLEVVSEKGLYFVDSRTSADTVGLRLAREMGIPSAKRKVFLDNNQSPGKVRSQLELLAREAGRQGMAVAIGHPHPGTVEALREMVPRLLGQGYEFVPVSEVLQ